MRFLFFLLFILNAQTYALVPQIQHFEAYCDDIFKDVMSYSVAVVHKGQVVLKKNVGHVYKGGHKVNADTLYAVASVSKPLSALYIAYLEKQKKT